MTDGNSFPIEEFLEAIRAQLDKTQDNLRLNAIIRPLTFALKEFALDLKVFVEMDEEGTIKFRPSGPNETGASTVTIGFTTITRPMVAENTVSMAMTRSPGLEELGLKLRERRLLERLGVQNAAQLNRLRKEAGNNTVSRLSGVSIERLRGALRAARPRLHDIVAEPEPDGPLGPDAAPPEETPPEPPQVTPAGPGPFGPGRPISRPELPPRVQPDIEPQPRPPRVRPDIRVQPPRPRQPPRVAPPGPERISPAAPDLPVLRVAPGTRRLRLRGSNLVQEERPPRIRLNDRPLQIEDADDDELVVELPQHDQSGLLEVEMPDGRVEQFNVTFEELAPEAAAEGAPPAERDPWLPSEGGS